MATLPVAMQPAPEFLAPLTALGFRPAARLRPRSAREIGSSPWTIGAETLDRDYADFSQAAPHLGPLGATRVRLQAGWARCEPAPGVYDWAWLDAIIDASLAQGVRPWLQTSYGNPLYPGGGGRGLADPMPASPEALAAWDRWVHALATRYAGRVQDWEIWNEPDLHAANTPELYTALFIRTAAILREVRPDARISALGLAHDEAYVERFLENLVAAGRSDLLDEITFHFYRPNPDDAFECVARLEKIRDRLAPHVRLAQGENGAPSESGAAGALRERDWNERKQAAWNTRRLLAHHARGYPMSLFSLVDMFYTQGRLVGANRKGLLHANADKTISHRKQAYFAARHVFTVFDGRFPSAPAEPLPVPGAPFRVEARAWRIDNSTTPALAAWWRSDAEPAFGPLPLIPIRPALPSFRDPVLVDFLGGLVFEPPADLDTVPCADTPLALAERDILPLTAL